MKSRKHSKLKRHPLIRFIRGIFRLFRVVFRPKKSLYRAEYHQNFTEESLELEPNLEPRLEHKLKPRLEPIRENAELVDRNRANSITVGELFLKIKWQSQQATMPTESADPVTVLQAYDVSRN
jgi:hypothetical protein